MSKGQGEATKRPMNANLSYRVSILHSLLARRTANIYVSRGLTSHQWKVISVLYYWGGMPATRITELVTLDKSSISRAVNALLKLRLVDKQLHAFSGVIDVLLTQAGRQTYEGMAEEMKSIQKDLFSGISAADRDSFFRTMDQIEMNMREEG